MNKSLSILLNLLLILIISVTPAYAGGGAAKPAGPKGIFPMETFIINLGAKGEFLKMTLQLKMLNDEVPEKMPEFIPVFRNKIIYVTSGKTSAELLTLEGKETMVKELIAQLNELIGREIVEDIYMTEFIVQ